MKRLMVCFALAALVAGCAQEQPEVAASPPPSPDPVTVALPLSVDAAQRANFGPATCAEADAAALAAIQMQVLVASLNCARHYEMPDAFNRYRELTNRHAPTIREAQVRLVELTGGSTREFDRLQTALANQLATEAGGSAQKQWCRAREGWFAEVLALKPADFKTLAMRTGAARCEQTTAGSARRSLPPG